MLPFDFIADIGWLGLSLLEYEGLKPVDPAYALPVDVIDKVFYTQKDARAVTFWLLKRCILT